MATATGAPSNVLEAKLGSGTSKVGKIGVGLFGVVVVCGFIYAADRLISDLYGTHSSGLAFVLLGIALLMAACPVLVLRAQLKSEQETPSQASRSVVTC